MLSILSDYSGIVNIVSKIDNEPLEIEIEDGKILLNSAPDRLAAQLAPACSIQHDSTLEAAYAVSKALDADYPADAQQLRDSLIS